jgi:hypothetical protein
MPYKITDSDYSKILTYYGLTIPKNKKTLKNNAESILAKKLCSCIKKVGGPQSEPLAIGACTKSVLIKKGLTRGKFNCKNGRKITLIKSSRRLRIKNKNTRKNH